MLRRPPQHHVLGATPTVLLCLCNFLISAHLRFSRPLHLREDADASDEVPYIFSVSDIHGDPGRFWEALVAGNLTDSHGSWLGGKALLVHTGDSLDRGPNTRGVLRWWRQLHVQAAAAGGTIHMLFGNHEVMNLMSDLRYNHPKDVELFGGKLARADAFAKDGEVGSWLLSQFKVCLVDAWTIYVHAGVSPKFASLGCDGINDVAARELRNATPSIRQLQVARESRCASRSCWPYRRLPMLDDEDGPVWYRGYALEPEAIACPKLEWSLAQLGVARMVVGHTIQEPDNGAPGIGRMRLRCDGRLVLTDTGFSRAFNPGLGSSNRAAILRVPRRGGMGRAPLLPVEPIYVRDEHTHGEQS
jgi:hypothetical protein